MVALGPGNSVNYYLAEKFEVSKDEVNHPYHDVHLDLLDPLHGINSPKDEVDKLLEKFFSNDQLVRYSSLFHILKRIAKDEKLSYNKKLKL